MLTQEDFNDMANMSIFASGTGKIPHPMKKGKTAKIKWVAFKNGTGWQIRTGSECDDNGVIQMYGAIVQDEATIRKYVPCDDMIIGFYRK